MTFLTDATSLTCSSAHRDEGELNAQVFISRTCTYVVNYKLSSSSQSSFLSFPFSLINSPAYPAEDNAPQADPSVFLA